MLTEKLLLFILVIHFLADFAMQTHEQATTKYKCTEGLFWHVAVYSLVWLFSSYFIFKDIEKCVQFTVITFIFHWITDAITSNVSKSFFDKKDFHNGFVVIGFDQILHYLQLYLTFKFLL